MVAVWSISNKSKITNRLMDMTMKRLILVQVCFLEELSIKTPIFLEDAC